MLKPKSLQSKLNKSVAYTCLLFAFLASGIGGVVTFIEVGEYQDDHIEQISKLISSPLSKKIILPSSEEDEKIQIVPLIEGGSSDFPISMELPDGWHSLNWKNSQWRVLVVSKELFDKSSFRFAVIQEEETQYELAYNICLFNFFIVLILMPLLIWIIHLIIKYNFKSMKELSQQVGERDESDLTPIPETNVPQEIYPFVLSINSLFVKVSQVLNQQRRFISDATHELRTPLTSVSLLVEQLNEMDNKEPAKQRIKSLQTGILKIQRLVHQLLHLAKYQNKLILTSKVSNLKNIVLEVIVELHSFAEAKQIDLGVNLQESFELKDFEGGLSILCRNAIHNAVQCTKAHGKIDINVFCKDGFAYFQVIDNGQGIPEIEMAHIFEPFFRASNNMEEGTGLGLAISLEIAKKLDGNISLKNVVAGGIEFTYKQPLK